MHNRACVCAQQWLYGFAPLTDVVLLASVTEVKHALELEDWDGLQFITIGPGASRLR